MLIQSESTIQVRILDTKHLGLATLHPPPCLAIGHQTLIQLVQCMSLEDAFDVEEYLCQMIMFRRPGWKCRRQRKTIRRSLLGIMSVGHSPAYADLPPLTSMRGCTTQPLAKVTVGARSGVLMSYLIVKGKTPPW